MEFDSIKHLGVNPDLFDLDKWVQRIMIKRSTPSFSIRKDVMQLPPFGRLNITSFSISLNYKVATYLPNYLSLERALFCRYSLKIKY